MQLLWIGCLENDEEFKDKVSKGYNLASAQVSQTNLLLGLEEVSGLVFDSISGSVLPPYPVYKDRDIKPVLWKHKAGSFDISVGYRNDKYINRVNCKRAMLAAADQWVKTRYRKGDLIIFVYSMRSAPMAAACHIKQQIPRAGIYLIVTDLPQFMDLGQSRLKAVLKYFDWQSIKSLQKQFDGFILYASKMAEFLGIPDKKWILMEGSYDPDETTNKQKLMEEAIYKKKAVMYSGKLDKEYGIPLLVDAFMQIRDRDAELWLTGGGNAEGYIRECSKKDRRIKYYGFLPSREDVLKMQNEAALLANMRLPSEAASAYCFPSKLFEYMASGVPVLSFKLEGIPREYYKYLILFDDESAAGIRNKIAECLGKEYKELKLLGDKAAGFIMKKNKVNQCKKVWDFVAGRI